MTVDRIVHLVAGLMILMSLYLAHSIHENWMWLTVFIGVNLAQSGLTNFCPLAAILKRIGISNSSSCCS